MDKTMALGMGQCMSCIVYMGECHYKIGLMSHLIATSSVESWPHFRRRWL